MTSIPSSELEGVHAEAATPGLTYRWVILFLTWFALLISFVDRLAWSNVALEVGRTLNMPMTALGAYVTAFYVGYVISNALTGFLTDRFGARLGISLGLLLLGLCTLAFGLTQSFLAGLVIQALMGVASGIDYSSGVKLNAVWFAKLERGRAFGIYMTATSLAVVAANSVVPPLAAHLDWRGAYYVLGLVTIAIGALAFAAIRNGAGESPAVGKPPFRMLFAKRDLLMVNLAGFGAMWGTWGFAFWANTLMVKGHNLTPAEAAGIMVLVGIAAIVSKPLIGVISDWLGGMRKLPLIVVLVAFALCLAGFGHAATAEQFRLVAPLLGFFAFVYSPLMGAMVAEIAGPSLAASATGVTNAFWQTGSVIVPVVVGGVFQMTGSFSAAFATLAAGPAFGALMMLFVRGR
jgi:sugar phosphate permease